MKKITSLKISNKIHKGLQSKQTATYEVHIIYNYVISYSIHACTR